MTNEHSAQSSFDRLDAGMDHHYDITRGGVAWFPNSKLGIQNQFLSGEIWDWL